MNISNDETEDRSTPDAFRALNKVGWGPHWLGQFEPYAQQGLHPARVTCEHREAYDVIGLDGEMRAEISGRFRHIHSSRAEWPAVGDWVAVAPRPDEALATIHAVLPRRSRFSRKTAGERTEEQIVAANVDLVFLVTGLDGDFNVRRVERYLTVAWDSGARPAIVLNKADVCADLPGCIAEVEDVALGVPVLAVSAAKDEGLDALRAMLPFGSTAAFLGSSGVGKSSLVNALLGESFLATNAVREDDSRGRHTTTRRQLILLPGGASVIDTPGMRELQLWSDEGGLGNTFADVELLAEECRFADCTHRSEPGCAVQRALETGTLPPERFRAYQKLQREIQYTTLRQEQSARLIEKNRWKKIAQEIRRIEKGKGFK